MTFNVLRALHAIIGEALDDIERVYADNSPPTSPSSASPVSSPIYTHFPSSNESSPPSSPLRAQFQNALSLTTPPSSPAPGGSTFSPVTPKQTPLQQKRSLNFTTPTSFPSLSSGTPPSPLSKLPLALGDARSLLDFPSLDAPYNPTSPEELLTAHPAVVTAINRIVAACGQMSVSLQKPLLTLCDAAMGFHLPSCLRFLETTHIVEILREAGTDGLHVAQIAERCGCERGKVAHILRLLATHHILCEVAPDVFANNRVSSCMDTRKGVDELLAGEREGSPERKYDGTNGVSALVGLCTDEIFKASAFMTEAYVLDPKIKFSREPDATPFNLAFNTASVFFRWLEGIDGLPMHAVEGQGVNVVKENWNRFRLVRFGKAMTGTVGWEAPGAVFQGFDWASLPPESVVVDVGGGIGSTSMLLAETFNHLRFLIQDLEVVVEMGEKAWRERCPELLDSGRVAFQFHDFFTLQPVKAPAVFFLRVVLHDWPDHFARRILLRLREVAGEDTKLVIADFVMPTACSDDIEFDVDAGASAQEDAQTSQSRIGVEGAEQALAAPPLLANLGKASANVYWMDMTMQVIFNSQERTLREIVKLAFSAGWKVVKITRGEGLFGHMVAVPVPIPVLRDELPASGTLPSGTSSGTNTGKWVHEKIPAGVEEPEMPGQAGSRCATPTFGSKIDLPSAEEFSRRFSRMASRSRSSSGSRTTPGLGKGIVLESKKIPKTRKKRPSPLASVGLPSVLAFSSSSPRFPGPASPASPTTSFRTHSLQPPPNLPPLRTPQLPPSTSRTSQSARMSTNKVPFSSPPAPEPDRKGGSSRGSTPSVLSTGSKIGERLPLDPEAEY